MLAAQIGRQHCEEILQKTGQRPLTTVSTNKLSPCCQCCGASHVDGIEYFTEEEEAGKTEANEHKQKLKSLGIAFVTFQDPKVVERYAGEIRKDWKLWFKWWKCLLNKVQSYLSQNKFLVSKETLLVLRRCESEARTFGLIKRLEKGRITNVRDLERWRERFGKVTLETSAFQISNGGNSTFIDSFHKAKFSYLSQKFAGRSEVHHWVTRQKSRLRFPNCRLTTSQRSFVFSWSEDFGYNLQRTCRHQPCPIFVR